MWTFSIIFFQGTFGTKHGFREILAHARRCKDRGFAKEKLYVTVHPLRSLLQDYQHGEAERKAFRDASITMEQHLRLELKRGRIYYDSYLEAFRARKAFVEMVRQVIEEVYGQ